jgi:MGT family glycosyltransferase
LQPIAAPSISGRDQATSQPRISPKIDAFADQGEPIAEALNRVILHENPEFLIIDPSLWGGMIAAEGSGIPWATIAHCPTLFRAQGLDVRGPGLRPARGRLGAAWHRLVKVAVSTANEPFLGEVNRVRLARELEPIADLGQLYMRATLVIATTAEPFEYPRDDWAESVRFVGPLLWEPPADRPQWIDQISGERPVILVSASTVPGVDETWVQTVLGALANEPAEIIVTMPAAALPAVRPANTRLLSFVPHGLLLPITSCVVCQGGFGTTQRSLAAGVPVVAVPDVNDQFEVARRIEVVGAGVMLPRKKLSAVRVRAAIRKALKSKPVAERISRAFLAAGGSAAAANAVEEFLPVRAERTFTN